MRTRPQIVYALGAIGMKVVQTAIASGAIKEGRFQLRCINEPRFGDEKVKSPAADARRALYLFDEKPELGISFMERIRVVDRNRLEIDGQEVFVATETDPRKLAEIDALKSTYRDGPVVIDCSRFAAIKEGFAEKHLQAGAGAVVISAGAKYHSNIIRGLGHREVIGELIRAGKVVVGVGSCTSNCGAFLVHTFHKKFGMISAFLVTIHGPTTEGNILYGYNPNSPMWWYPVTNWALPGSTGAASFIGQIFPEIGRRLDGMSIRVPADRGHSIATIVFMTEKKISTANIREALAEAADRAYGGHMVYHREVEPLFVPVSDVACVADGSLSQAMPLATREKAVTGFSDDALQRASEIGLTSALESLREKKTGSVPVDQSDILAMQRRLLRALTGDLGTNAVLTGHYAHIHAFSHRLGETAMDIGEMLAAA